MSFLFNMENGVCKPKEEALLTEPFKGMWESDSRKAIRHFTVIELYTSKLKSNPYAGYPDDYRLQLLTKQNYGREVKYDDLEDCVKEGIRFLEDVQRNGSPTYSYYMSQLRAVEKLKEFFMAFDLDERNEKGQLIYKPKEITSALADAEKIVQNLTVLRDKVDQELFVTIKTRANREVGRYEE